MPDLHPPSDLLSDSSSIASAQRFHALFDQAPGSMQLLAADGRTLQVNRAWEALWLAEGDRGLKDYVLSGRYNVLTDPQLLAKGVTPFLSQAFAGQSVQIPAIFYDPAELGKTGRGRWVKATAHPIKGEDGSVHEVMLMHEDITDRIEAEHSLRRSEERFRSLVMASSQIIWTATAAGEIVDDSPSWRAFTGQTCEEWIGFGWLDAIHPDDRAGALAAWTGSVAGESLYLTHYRVRRRDGEYRWTAAKGVPILDQYGAIREWIGANTDITEQIRAEEAVRNSEQRLRFVLDSMQQKIFTATAAGDVDYFNPAWNVFTGLSFEAIRDWGWLQFIHPDDVDENIRVWKHSIDTGEPFKLEHRFRRADGQYRWHLSRAVPLRDDAGQILMWVGSNTDVHEIKTAESELAHQLVLETRHAELLKKVASASRTIHAALSEDDIAHLLVEEVRHILGVHQAVVSLTANENWAQAINAVSLSEKYAAYRSYNIAPDGSGIYAEVCRTNKAMRFTQAELEQHPAWKGFGKHAAHHPAMRGWLAVPLVAHDGSNLGLIQASDKLEGEFTEQDEAVLAQLASIAATGFENARLYGSLQEQDRRKDEFLAMLAHELRNPLAPILAAAQLMERVELDPARLKKTSQVVSRQVRHMVGLVDDLLDVSRVTRGLVILDNAALDMKRIVQDAVEQVQPLLQAKRHALQMDLSEEPVQVLGDAKRLVQILTNLLNNAVKYTPEGGTLQLQMAASDYDVTVTVTDNGVGIERAMQARIFDLFAQAERTADRSQGGLGIGLALVKSLVELHGGTVTCESQGTGSGSRFIVTLPRLQHAQPVHAPELTGHLHAPARRLRILIVDDNIDAARMLAMFMEAAGHAVDVEHEPALALELARREAHDVCVLDIGLPGMDGHELARRLRECAETQHALLVAVTGYGHADIRSKAMAAGFDHHLVKPVNAGDLLALLDKRR